jgi:hypothetical protein
VAVRLTIVLKGSDRTIESDPYTSRADAEEDIESIRRARSLYLLDRLNQAEKALPPWLAMDPGMILAAWIIETD